MKRNELYNYIKTEIINELSEAPVPTTITDKSGVSKVLKVDNADAASITTIKTDPNITSATMGATKLKEMARKAGALKAGAGFEEAKSIFTNSRAAKVLELVEKAGEAGITTPEIMAALGIKNMPQINPLIRELIAIGAITKDGKAADQTAEPEVEEPETTEPEMAVEPEEEEEIEIEDEDETTKDEEEDEEVAAEFEKEPSDDAVKKEKGEEINKEEIEKINKAREILIKKRDKILAADKNNDKVTYRKEIDLLKAYIKNNKDIIKKGKLTSLLSDLINVE